MKDYDRWFVIQFDYGGATVDEFDSAGQAQDYVRSQISGAGRVAKVGDFQVIYGREFEVKVTEREIEKVTKLEFV